MVGCRSKDSIKMLRLVIALQVLRLFQQFVVRNMRVCQGSMLALLTLLVRLGFKPH